MVNPKCFCPQKPEQTLPPPCSPVEWVPKDHLTFFLLDLAAELDLEKSSVVQVTNASGEIQALRQLLEGVELEGMLAEADALHANRPFSSISPRSGTDVLIAVQDSRRKAFRLIRDRFPYSRHAPWQPSNREVKRGRDISWALWPMTAAEQVVKHGPGTATIIAVRSHGIRDRKPTDKNRYGATHLRTGATALLQHIRDRQSREQLALGAGRIAEERPPPEPRGQWHPDPGHHAQPGHQNPAPRWNPVDHRAHRRGLSRHQGPARAA